MADDAEILARYKLDSFTSAVFGADHAAEDSHRQSRQADELGLDGMQELITERGGSRSSKSNASRRRHGGEQRRNGDYEDESYDEDEGEYDGRQRARSAGGEASGSSMAISDRDPLYVYQSVGAVLERKGDPQALGDMAYRAQFSISSRSFSPTAFMQTVHGDTAYGELAQGARLLRESVSQGTEALKILVHNNFDRFVDARVKIDQLYEEMKTRSLNDRAEFGTRAFNQSLQSTTRKADEIYNPIIERRARAEKIRSTLSVIERYKFYFNLPSSLIEYTRQSRFDVAVREYKKGRQLLQAVTDGAMEDGSQATALGKIFQHVWNEVQESVVELRTALFRRLAQPNRAYSEQENVIRYLLEIDPGETDPVAFYLERQHTWIVDKMAEDYREHRLKTVTSASRPTGAAVGAKSSTSSTGTEPSPDDERRAAELERALGIESFEDFPAFSHGRDAEFHAWKHIYAAVRALSQTLVRRLPDFWKLCQAFMEELYQKPAAPGAGRRRRQGLNLEKVSKCHTLLEEIIETYSRHVLRLLGILGDDETVVNLESLDSAHIAATMQRIPQTHALLAGHFMSAISEMVVNAANDIEAIDMAQEPAIILANLISQLKAGLVLFLCEMWDRDARAMPLHESWRLHHGTAYWPPFFIGRRDNAANSDDSPAVVAETIANTELVPLFLRTAQTVLGQLGAIHAVALQPSKGSHAAHGQTPHFDATFDEGQRQQSERSHKMHDMAMAHVKRTFFGSMYAFLDSLHVLVFNTQAQDGASGNGRLLSDSSSSVLQRPQSGKPQRRLSFNSPPKADANSELAARRRHSIAEVGSGRNTHSFHVLATLCNLTAFRLFVVPDLLHAKAVRYTFRLDMADELPRLELLLRRLDDMIFSFYICDKARELSAIVRRGVLMGGFSWTTAEMPRDPQPYVSEALLYLVFIHAEIMDLIAEVGAGGEHHMVKQQPLTKRVFQVLTANLAQDMLESIRAIDAFSEGGMLQCVLEAQVIQQTLQSYMTAPATECFRLLYAYVRAAYDRAQERARKLAAQQGRAAPEPASGDTREINGVKLTTAHWDIIRKLLRDCTRRTQIHNKENAPCTLLTHATAVRDGAGHKAQRESRPRKRTLAETDSDVEQFVDKAKVAIKRGCTEMGIRKYASLSSMSATHQTQAAPRRRTGKSRHPARNELSSEATIVVLPSEDDYGEEEPVELESQLTTIEPSSELDEPDDSSLDTSDRKTSKKAQDSRGDEWLEELDGLNGLLRDVERQCATGLAGGLKRHPELSGRMRPILVDWLMEVAADYRMHRQTLHLTVQFLDRFLAHTRVEVAPGMLQCYGTACLALAMKAEEQRVPTLSELTEFSKDAFTRDQLRQAEIDVLVALRWRLAVPTLFEFLGLFFQRAACRFPARFASAPQQFNARQFAAACDCADALLHFHDSLRFPPSALAAACFYVASAPCSLDGAAFAQCTGYAFPAVWPAILHLKQLRAALALPTARLLRPAPCCSNSLRYAQHLSRIRPDELWAFQPHHPHLLRQFETFFALR
ncbi:Exocyst complex component S5 [Coemansia sp. RSA 2336]|nr:Exocyst complex component S5 [Coemansia sp. RSA 2336]